MTTTTPKDLELTTADGKACFRSTDDGYRMTGIYRSQGGRFTLFEDMQPGEIERAWLALRSWREQRQR